MLKDVEQIPYFPDLEKGVLKFWEENKSFEKLVQKNKGHKKWSFFDGPITANNPMGVHHAWGRTYKDIFIRHRAMQGFDQRYQNGFDCQGLWVEVVVEKDLNLNSKREIMEYGLGNFSTKCRERVEKFSQIQTQQSIRLGQWMDWENSYYTMHDSNIETIWHFLKKCHERGWLYQGHRCMPWCTRCGTSLSQHELHDSYHDMKHRSVTMHLPIVERPGEYIMVWTTTPWTLSANTALAVHPDLDYVKVEWEGKILYLSKGTVSRLKKGAKEVGMVKGQDLVGLHYRGPMEIPARQNLELRVVPWTAVGEEEGTGVVHIAPGCGAEDYELSKAQNLAVLIPIDESGYYVSADFGPLYGKRTSQVVDIVFSHLKEHGYFYDSENYEHRYPVCWRCQDELVFRLVDEWFIRCDEIREPMKKAAASVEWMPEYAGMHMQNWLDNMGDWCISRRRFWGLPLPFFKCDACGKWTVVGSKKELQECAVSGLEGLKELHKPWIDDVKITCSHCGHKGLSRVSEVGDCWLDAGIIPFSTLNYLHDKSYWQEWYPCEFITEMIEQVRLWFYSLLFMSVTLEDRAPYKKVLTYSAVVDEEGAYFSKTKGNAIPFDIAAEKIGADLMRWMYAGQNNKANLRFGYKPAEEVRRKILNFWNVYRFYVTYAKLDNPDVSKAIPADKMPELDRWLLCRLNSYLQIVSTRLQNYDVAGVTKETEELWDHLSNWYLRRSRRRFWKSENDQDKSSAYYTLYTTIKTICLALAPIIPFTTEYIYQNLVRGTQANAPESVHHNDYPVAQEDKIDRSLLEDMEIAMAVCTLGHAARESAKTKVRQPLPCLLVKLENEQNKRGVERFAEIIKDELNVKAIQFVQNTEDFHTYDIKPNLKLLGKKYGKKMDMLKESLAKLDPKEVGHKVTHNENVEMILDGENITLKPEEILATQKKDENFCSLQDKDMTIVLDTRVTQELREEGAMRDLIRQIQNMRKDADFQVSDHIHILYQTEDEFLRRAIQNYRSYIMQETLCDSIKEETPQGNFQKEMDLGEGKIILSVARN